VLKNALKEEKKDKDKIG